MEEINLTNEISPEKKGNKYIWAIVAVLVISFLVIISVVVVLVPGPGRSNQKLEVTGTTLSVEYNEYLGYSASITGVAKNTTKKHYSYASLEFSVYDANGNNLGTAIANINNLLSGDTWSFEANLFSFPRSRPTSYKLVDITAW